MKLVTVYYGGEWSRYSDIQAARRAYTLLRDNGHTLKSPNITKHNIEPPSALIMNDNYHNHIHITGSNIDDFPNDLYLSGDNVDVFIDEFEDF